MNRSDPGSLWLLPESDEAEEFEPPEELDDDPDSFELDDEPDDEDEDDDEGGGGGESGTGTINRSLPCIGVCARHSATPSVSHQGKRMAQFSIQFMAERIGAKGALLE